MYRLNFTDSFFGSFNSGFASPIRGFTRALMNQYSLACIRFYVVISLVET